VIGIPGSVVNLSGKPLLWTLLPILPQDSWRMLKLRIFPFLPALLKDSLNGLGAHLPPFDPYDRKDAPENIDENQIRSLRAARISSSQGRGVYLERKGGQNVVD